MKKRNFLVTLFVGAIVIIPVILMFMGWGVTALFMLATRPRSEDNITGAIDFDLNRAEIPESSIALVHRINEGPGLPRNR